VTTEAASPAEFDDLSTDLLRELLRFAACSIPKMLVNRKRPVSQTNLLTSPPAPAGGEVKKRLATFVAAIFFLAAAFPFASQAQMEPESTFEVGPRATLDLGDISDLYDGTFAIGGDVRYESAEFPVKGSGAFDSIE
jgi:hypothetical protein